VINFTDTCNRYLWITGIGLYSKGYDAFKANDLVTASKFFTQIFEVIPYDKENNLKRNNITPDIVNKNLYLVAHKANDAEKEKMYLQKLIDAKFNEPMIYVYMSSVYLTEKDTAKALSYIEMGKKLFEENMPLMEEEARIYILQGRIDELIKKVSENIEANPENEMLYYKRARLYQSKKTMDKAEADFKKSIELKPELMEANYDLGGLYFNQAAEMANAANAIKSTEDFNKAKAQFEKKFKDAQPYLEKAKELNPKKTEDDMSLYKATLLSLKSLYARTNQTDKYTEVKAELDKK
jgi:tetratricopeptide (TPR) repeat protein